MRISIHAPRMGRDFLHPPPCIFAEISIHAPRMGRDGHQRLCTLPRGISIHAPRMGRDSGALRRPRAGCVFQSTRPVWGATPIGRATLASREISIHAPRMGRDKAVVFLASLYDNFNPRAPYGARPVGAYNSMFDFKFQSTRPVWGATA